MQDIPFNSAAPVMTVSDVAELTRPISGRDAARRHAIMKTQMSLAEARAMLAADLARTPDQESPFYKLCVDVLEGRIVRLQNGGSP